MWIQRTDISPPAAQTLVTYFSAGKEGQPGRIVGREMRGWGVERTTVGEQEQQELVWQLTGVVSSRCCHSYPDPGRDGGDINSVLWADPRTEE